MAPSKSVWLALVAILVLLPLLSYGEPLRVCEDSKQQQVLGAGVSGQQLVYNPNRREYFAVYIHSVPDEQEGTPKTSVMGQRFNESGKELGSPISIYPWGPDLFGKGMKQFPVVAHNSNKDNYLVLWENAFSGSDDWDVIARAVPADGTTPSEGVFFVGVTIGREDSPHLAFSPKDNNFVVVHEVEGRTGRGIRAQRLNETHMIGSATILNTSYTDREPFVAYHPPSNDFLLVWEYDRAKQNKSEIVAVVLTGESIHAKGRPNVVGSTIEVIGGHRTIAHDHDAQLAYSTKDDHFFMVWEVDGDSGEKEVVCNLVNPDATAKIQDIQLVGNDNHPFDRKPSVVYLSATNEFFVAYESGPNNVSTRIEGVAIASNTSLTRGTPFSVSQALNSEHAPTLALSTACGDILALWTSDTSLRRSTPPVIREPVAAFARDSAHLQARTESAPYAFTEMRDTMPSKFTVLGKKRGDEGVVPHAYLSDVVPANTEAFTASSSGLERRDASTSFLQSIRVCAGGRSSCSGPTSPSPSAAPSSTPKPSPSGGGSSAVGVVLGVLGAVVVLAGLGAGGYVGWRRYPQIREWLESRRAGIVSTGVWADESEFSISIDAFTGSGDDDTAGDDEH